MTASVVAVIGQEEEWERREERTAGQDAQCQCFMETVKKQKMIVKLAKAFLTTGKGGDSCEGGKEIIH